MSTSRIGAGQTTSGGTGAGWPLRALPWLLLLAFGFVAAGLRFHLIESTAIADLCGSGQYSPWCNTRQLLILGFQHHAYDVSAYGTAALISAVLALWSKQVWIAWLAAVLGIFALQLYCFEPGALALLIGCLRLLRLQARPRMPPGEQHRQREQQIQSQP
jgi:hypothetical protein